jgi:hypothetical protein
MGSANQPSVLGRFRAPFLRRICHQVEEMQGEVQINDWRVALEGGGFEPKLGIVNILIISEGLLPCLIWIHVDNIFLHRPMCAKCTSALKNILDLKVRLCLICHPTKLKMTAHIHKLFGFMYDFETIPKLRVSENEVLGALTILGLPSAVWL